MVYLLSYKLGVKVCLRRSGFWNDWFDVEVTASLLVGRPCWVSGLDGRTGGHRVSLNDRLLRRGLPPVSSRLRGWTGIQELSDLHRENRSRFGLGGFEQGTIK